MGVLGALVFCGIGSPRATLSQRSVALGSVALSAYLPTVSRIGWAHAATSSAWPRMPPFNYGAVSAQVKRTTDSRMTMSEAR